MLLIQNATNDWTNFFYLTHTVLEISKVVCKKTLLETRAFITSWCCMKRALYCKCMLYKQGCFKFHWRIAWQFFFKQLCWFLRCSAGKKYQDFVQQLVAFPISNISYWQVAYSRGPFLLALCCVALLHFTHCKMIAAWLHCNAAIKLILTWYAVSCSRKYINLSASQCNASIKGP